MRRLLNLLLLVAAGHAADTYVVAVGVDRYDRDYAISALNYAVADVKAVAQAFRDAGVPESHVRLLTSDMTDAVARPSAANVLSALSRAAKRCEPGDTLVFMFSGHGLQAGEQSYLLTSETDPDLLDRTALRVADVRDTLAPARGAHLLLLLDACRNEPRKGKGDGDAKLDDRFAKGMSVWPTAAAKPVVLLACDVGQRAWEDPDDGHGVFTSFLLKGLAREARAADGSVRLVPLADYVSQAVPVWAERHGQQQKPRLERPAGVDFCVLGPRAGAVAPTAVLTLTSQPTGARVWLDGQLSGQSTDCQLTLEVGAAQEKTVEVGLELPGYAFAVRRVKLERGSALTVATVLERATQGLPPNWPAYLAKWRSRMPVSLQYRLAPKDNMPQVLIPAGEFLMGSPVGQGSADSQPQRRVFVSSFWMDLHNVTVGQYQAFCAATGTPAPPLPGRPLHAMHKLSYADARLYAKWVGRALPTEAQWERAARGGLEGKRFPWGDDPEGDGTNPGSPTRANATNVGALAPNGFGLFDMVGTVWQWCRDNYSPDWYQRMPERDPYNDRLGDLRVARGGGAGLKRGAWIAYREPRGPGNPGLATGLRCVSAP